MVALSRYKNSKAALASLTNMGTVVEYYFDPNYSIGAYPLMAGGQAGQIGGVFVQHIDNKREKLGNTATVEMQAGVVFVINTPKAEALDSKIHPKLKRWTPKYTQS
ncbi:MAG: hypothetical protein KAI83_10385 [Thiomargarita sp.]|nr:hypothetical protein [Thiomargarita sp.]